MYTRLMATIDRRLALIASSAQRSATIDMVGRGHVGLPLELGYVAAGYRVLGFAIDADEVKAQALLTINRRKRYREPSDKLVKA